MPIEQALDRILFEARSPCAIETVPLLQALERILATAVEATIDVPGEDNSAMDGYALRASDASAKLTVAQRIPAGALGEQLAEGTAARIFTGAAVPSGADAVVMQEDCRELDGCITAPSEIEAGQHIRPRGQDIRCGETLLSPGRRLRPQDLGLLASVGCERVEVYRPLRVAIMSTGDELVDPGEPLTPGRIYNSNRYTLTGLLQALGCEVVDCGIVPDDARATAQALADAASVADCVISSGGVSVGEEDHVKAQVESLGALSVWKLAIKPGKPLAFGHVCGTPFLGLPGNPSSVFVTFVLIARPFLLRLQGGEEPTLPALYACSDFTVTRPGGRREYLRVTVVDVEGQLYARRFDNQSSGILSSVCYSNALAVIPAGETVAIGDSIEVVLLDTLTG